jgi:hypothetical protein
MGGWAQGVAGSALYGLYYGLCHSRAPSVRSNAKSTERDRILESVARRASRVTRSSVSVKIQFLSSQFFLSVPLLIGLAIFFLGI